MEKDSLFELLSMRINRMHKEEFNDEGIWTYHLPKFSYRLPNYGFKIHISATIENVLDIAEIIFPLLIAENIRFKFIKSISHLGFLNMGNYGYSQIGKMCTIYPKNTEALLYLLDICYKKTKKFASITIPSDFPYMCSSIVYYRYGELVARKDGNTESIDFRKKVIPNNICVPIEDYYISRLGSVSEKYIPLKCLRVRGKSSMYLAIDKESKKMCIMKKGDFLGEISLGGDDGLDKVYNEYSMLIKLEKTNIFPIVYDVFYQDRSLFIVEEFVEGETLTDILLNKGQEIENSVILLEILKYLNKVHLEGYIINDLSPDNIIVNKGKHIRFIDGEYSVNEDKYTKIMNLIGTPGFSKSNYSLRDKDLYFFICICYFFFNREHYSDLRKDTKQNFIEKVDENPRFLENIVINIEGIIGMEEKVFFDQNYRDKIETLKNRLKKKI